MDETPEKNRMEVNVSGITIRIKTTETVKYINRIADEVQEKMDSFFATGPSQGVDVSQRLLLSCLTFIDDRNKLVKAYDGELKELHEKAEFADKTATKNREKEIEWMNKYNAREKDYNSTIEKLKGLEENLEEKELKIKLLEKNTENLEVNKKLIKEFEEKEKNWEETHFKSQREVARLRSEKNTYKEELEKTKDELEGIEDVASKSKENIKKWENKISNMQREFELLLKENQELKQELEDAKILNELYEEEQKNESY